MKGDFLMATGERIHHFRKRMKMTQRYLGQLLGFPANSADVRMAQYESEDRNPIYLCIKIESLAVARLSESILII